MAQVEDSGSGRSVNTELNLVPFIDLMSVLITFLLATAVWSQISMIQLGSSLYAKKQDTQTAPEPPPPMADIPLRIDVKDTFLRVVIGNDKFEIPKQSGEYDFAKMRDKLNEIKKTYPEKVDAVITIDDEVKYDYLIRGMDSILKSGFPSISVATGGAE